MEEPTIIQLAKTNPIHPISYDSKGKYMDNTKYEIPGEIISSGKLAGKYCINVYLYGCNLNCAWYCTKLNKGILCHNHEISYPDLYTKHKGNYSIENVISILIANTKDIKNICFTGGEPLLQSNELKVIIKRLKKIDNKLFFILETNGTLYDDELISLCNFIRISPKLNNSVPYKLNLLESEIKFNEAIRLKHEGTRKNLRCLQSYITNRLIRKFYDFEFNFIISNLSDINEIENEYLKYLKGYLENDIYLSILGNDIDIIKYYYSILRNDLIKLPYKLSQNLKLTYLK